MECWAEFLVGGFWQTITLSIDTVCRADYTDVYIYIYTNWKRMLRVWCFPIIAYNSGKYNCQKSSTSSTDNQIVCGIKTYDIQINKSMACDEMMVYFRVNDTTWGIRCYHLEKKRPSNYSYLLLFNHNFNFTNKLQSVYEVDDNRVRVSLLTIPVSFSCQNSKCACPAIRQTRVVTSEQALVEPIWWPAINTFLLYFINVLHRKT